MTKKELIGLLDGVDDDAEVYIYDENLDEFYKVKDTGLRQDNDGVEHEVIYVKSNPVSFQDGKEI